MIKFLILNYTSFNKLSMITCTVESVKRQQIHLLSNNSKFNFNRTSQTTLIIYLTKKDFIIDTFVHYSKKEN